MYALFEEDGSFRAGNILADNTTSLQIELPSGKRSKVKAANVLLRFDTPSPGELLSRAEAQAADMDSAFLWECCGEAEFGFEEFAAEYAGGKPDAVASTAILLHLHGAPIYFHRKGKGRFRKAPADILQAALAGQEKKRQQALAIERMSQELQAGQLPEEFTPQLVEQLLYKPDRNRLECKALEAACEASAQSAAQLLMRCGAIKSCHELHLKRFLFEHFPQGSDGVAAAVPLPRLTLPLAEVRAFSIDDAHTTEIDDAFSVVPCEDGWQIGIHIAAPALGLTPEDALGQQARARLSTVYMPGHKITMLPTAVVEHYTLSAGRPCPAVSHYLELDSALNIRKRYSRLEQVNVAANLRHHEIEPLFNADTLAQGLGEFAWRDELQLLWQLANQLEVARGKAGQAQNQNDFNFDVIWEMPPTAVHSGELALLEPGRIHIERRPRGSPLDKLVSELMIVANAGWGQDLADAGVAALYRAQTSGKVRMTTVAAPHEGLGVACYSWLTSPLRRYADLLNQWQLVAWLSGETPQFSAKNADFLAALRDFELTYAAYGEFQRGMERYWCLRWLAQEEVREVSAQVIRDDLLRLDSLPLVVRVAGLPELPAGQRLRLAIERIDYFDNDLRLRFLELINTPASTQDSAPDSSSGNANTASSAPPSEASLAG